MMKPAGLPSLIFPVQLQPADAAGEDIYLRADSSSQNSRVTTSQHDLNT